jgi:hypothetical protein
VWLFLVVAVAILLVLFVLRGSPELARLEVRNGKPRFVSGRMPPKLLDDFEDVLSDRSIAKAVVQVVVESGQPRVVAKGLPEHKLQQLRNVAGRYPTAQFRKGRPPAR